MNEKPRRIGIFKKAVGTRTFPFVSEFPQRHHV